MDKYMDLINAFLGFLKTLLGNVLGDKLGAYAKYEDSVSKIAEEAKKAFID